MSKRVKKALRCTFAISILSLNLACNPDEFLKAINQTNPLFISPFIFPSTPGGDFLSNKLSKPPINVFI